MPKNIGYGKAAKGKPAFGKAMNAMKKGKGKSVPTAPPPGLSQAVDMAKKKKY